MLRDASLIPLSKQHHNALVLCVTTRRTLARGAATEIVAQLARKAIDRYELELVNHFEIEEQVLFPVCGSLPLIAQLLAEHRSLGAMIARLREAPSRELLEEFCDLLSTHIRREERQLFEEIQRSLPRDVLDRAGAEIARRAVGICF